MQVDIYPSVDAAREWFGQWETLAEQNLFLSPSWLSPLIVDEPVAVCVASKNGTLHGVLPLVHRKKGNIAVGLGDHASDYGGFLYSDNNSDVIQSMIEAAFHHLKVNRLRLRHIPQDSHSDEAFKKVARQEKWVVEYRDRSQNFCLPLVQGDFEKTLAGLRSAKSRYNLRRSYKKLNEQAEVSFCKAASVSDIETALLWLGQKHAAMWPKSIYRSKNGLRQMVQQAENLLKQNRLGLFWLQQNGAIIAAALGMMTPGRFYYYNVAYDESLAQYSPGGLLLQQILGYVCLNMIQAMDLLVGPEPYKIEWGGVPRTLNTYTICNPFSLSGKMLGGFLCAFRRKRILS